MKNKFKRIKFKDNCLSFKRFNQIIFEDKNLKKENRMIFRPSNWHSKKIKLNDRHLELHSPHFKIPSDAPIRKMVFYCYYKGKLVNGKYEGLGTEIILEDGNYMKDVFSFYKGQWKNGKKHGKGYWSNHHPLIGTTSSADAMNPKYTIMTNFDCFYDGFWKDDKRHGEGYLDDQNGIFEGEFKNDKKWNGQQRKDKTITVIDKGKEVSKKEEQNLRNN